MATVAPNSCVWVDDYLDAQRKLTAVERFSIRHEEGLESSTNKELYRDLIPLSAPKSGEQYAFEVDLDSCTGCKACVTGCHEMNGLLENETWRSVGLLHGGTTALPILQHVTAACHHCLEPSCLKGCPVGAYEKDPVTGIVRHLDEICIGCQYCVFMCPYDVPKYDPSLGIVRKCDMCRDRLSVGEAPACVQSCPNEAIRIVAIDTDSARADAEANLFLPGVAAPQFTLPTTIYKTQRALPRNLLPADYHSVSSEHEHPALVAMLVLTQLSVGLFAADFWRLSLGLEGPGTNARPLRMIVALFAAILGLGAAVFHLGQPFRAFRAYVGLRTSWLSREIFLFGFFSSSAFAYFIAVLLKTWNYGLGWERLLGELTVGLGILAVFSSAMIYAATDRPFWRLTPTFSRFLLTSALLGLPAAALANSIGSGGSQSMTTHVAQAMLVLTVMKLTLELSLLGRLREKTLSPLKRAALLLVGDLAPVLFRRVFFAIVGGVALPLILLGENALTGGAGYHPLFRIMAVGWMFLLLLIGEFHERRLFFAAAIAPKMPGTV